MSRTLQPEEPFSKLLAFKRIWEEEYLETYIHTGKDLRFAKELTGVPTEEVERRARIFLAMREEWALNCKHSFPAFVNNIGKMITARPGQKRKQERRRSSHPAPMILCTNCGERHPADTFCQGKMRDLGTH